MFFFMHYVMHYFVYINKRGVLQKLLPIATHTNSLLSIPVLWC